MHLFTASTSDLLTSAGAMLEAMSLFELAESIRDHEIAGRVVRKAVRTLATHGFL